MKIVISSGHGKHVSGANGIINEVTEARRVVPKVVAYLTAMGEEVIEFHENNATNQNDNVNAIIAYHNLQARDLDVSVHFNAFQNTDKSMGVEVLYYTEASLAAKVAQAASDVSGLKNRGAKIRTDLGFLARTTKPAILIEVCFVDSTADVKLYQESFDKICRAIAEAISGKKINDTSNVTTKTPIIGDSVISAQALAAFLVKTNEAPKIQCTAAELANYFITEGGIEGVRGDIAFCQALHETGWFKYGGDVLPEQNNFCGLGATNTAGKGKGAWFDAPYLGVRAQIQHLKAYASKETLAAECVDPRFNLVTRGIAPNWEDLNGRWAVPGDTYAQSILSLFKDLKDFAEDYKPAQPESVHWVEQYYQYLNEEVVKIHDRRFDDPITRGETFALLAQICRKMSGCIDK